MPRQRSALNNSPWSLDLGSTFLPPASVRFRVWAPQARSVSVRLLAPHNLTLPLNPQPFGYWEGTVSPLTSGARYYYVLNGDIERPDPVSRFQPDGVHGPSMVIDPTAFPWTDQNWTGLPPERMIIYELHTGTFTKEGTFTSIIPRLPYLRDRLGVTAIELMPVVQFPGTRNWGYDGTYLFAPHASYGGPDGLKRLVDACHVYGLAVILDVVYNHLGPEGNYLADFGPYFTNRYVTPWGPAINYDGPDSDQVRHFVISNALYWATEYHIDGLRLDAVHGIYDFSATHLLQELAEAVHRQAQRLGRTIAVIAESDLNDSRIILPVSKGGYGLDAQWSDDFHHALHGVLTGERNGYYADFGTLDHLATAIREGYVYTGQYSSYRRRRHGNTPRYCHPKQFVIFAQNHDQVGNRAKGERLTHLTPVEALYVAAAAVLCSPNIPLLFMGEEYAEPAPFLYFIDHGDPALREAVRQGRRAEFSAFGWDEMPDPAAEETYLQSKLHFDLAEMDDTSHHQSLLRWYRTLIYLRKTLPALGAASRTDRLRVWMHHRERILTVFRATHVGPAVLLFLGFNPEAESLSLTAPQGEWFLQLDVGAKSFRPWTQETQAPSSLALPQKKKESLIFPPFGVWLYVDQTPIVLPVL
ncbi:MAG: malto-oligosyltrehalose trehalohydrolase [Nitrospirae bacterium]|nr:MAG: malto-oligosyltrehalose trehalohydrolase [Nitrospirota bacterium]